MLATRWGVSGITSGKNANNRRFAHEDVHAALASLRYYSGLSTHSHGGAIEKEEPAESFTALDSTCWHTSRFAVDQLVVKALMSAFEVIMLDEPSMTNLKCRSQMGMTLERHLALYLVPADRIRSSRPVRTTSGASGADRAAGP